MELLGKQRLVSRRQDEVLGDVVDDQDRGQAVEKKMT